LTNATAQLEIQTNALRQKINELTSANSQLQSKLREALAEQPAAVAPAEMAKLREQILALQKDRDLLRATLDQLKASKPAPKPSAANTESATPPAEIADIMYNFNMPVQKVMDEVYAPLVNRTPQPLREVR
jgi:chromosome segregation ATPase